MAVLLFGSACQSSRPKFYPIGIYSVPSTNDFGLIRQSGFNLVAGPADKPYLDAAERDGLKVLASPRTSAGKNFSAANARQAVRELDGNPALWAWYLVDEPDLNQVSPTDVLNAHRFIKRLNARKPTALVLYQGASALHYANITDLLMIDRYPIPWLPLANFPQHVRMARLALGAEKPLIAVIQAHDWSYYPELLPDEKNLRPPTYEELRCMTYCALAQRATGLFYYCFNDGRWNISEHPATWESLKRVISEVNERLPLFQAQHVWWPHLHEFKNPTTRFNAALESSVTPALLQVTRGNTVVAPGRYMLAVNNTGKKQGYRFYWPGIRIEAIPVLNEDRFVLTADGWIDDDFDPYAIHIYGPLPEAKHEAAAPRR